MNIIDIDYDKGIVQTDFFTWEIVCNADNQFMLLQREENGRFHAAEADIKKKQLWEVKELSFLGPDGATFIFDEETGVDKL